MIYPTGILPPRPMISTISSESIGFANRQIGGQSMGSIAWPSANRAIFVPFVLNQPINVLKLWTANGSSAANTRDVGIYDQFGTRIISSGSTAGSGTTTLQAYDTTDTVIGPGLFYFALASSNTTSQFMTVNNPINALIAQGVYQMASAFPLPATATFATTASAYMPVFGLSTVTTV